MLPVLFSIGPIPISSFGFFLSLAFLFATFLTWRLARAWDLSEEKILDLLLLTFFGALLGARVFFILQNFDLFGFSITKWFLLTKYSGLSFWGAFLGGWLTLFIFSRRLKEDFWQIADLASPGFLVGLALGQVGCLLGGCNIGILSGSFLGVTLVGVVGTRFPVQALEALLLFILLLKIWPLAKKFHFRGKIISLTLILVGLVKFTTSFFAANRVNDGPLSLILFSLGLLIFYKAGKRSFTGDLVALWRFSVSVLTERETRAAILEKARRGWYNQRIVWSLRFKNFFKFLKRRLNVKFAPKNVQ